MNYTTRFTKLLGECRRQMNGAVAGSMRYYGAEYGLNYGVSLPTIRSLASIEGKDHNYAKYLYQQQVREIRLASLHIAQAELIEPSELSFWAEGIINSEVAEEAAFALFQNVGSIEIWLDESNELLQYCAILSIAKSRMCDLYKILDRVASAIERESTLLTTAAITLLESYYKVAANRAVIDQFISDGSSDAYEEVREELEWRCQIYLD